MNNLENLFLKKGIALNIIGCKKVQIKSMCSRLKDLDILQLTLSVVL